MYSPSVKHKVRGMRKNGMSINDIATSLKMNKSTISYWCRDIVLNESAILKIKTKGREKSVQGLLRYSESKRKERIIRTLKYKNFGAESVGIITDRDLMMTGLGLYWGEGYKESNGELGFTNSNPLIIKFYIKWLSLWQVNISDLIFRLTLNSIFQKEKENIKKFWIDYLSINDSQFSKTTLIKTKLKKAFTGKGHKYKGILRVKVRRGLLLKNKILGAIDQISTRS